MGNKSFPNSLLDGIKSKYMINNIFNYIPDKDFQIKLFLFSKKYQKLYNINFSEIKEKYLKKIGFDIYDYIYIFPEDYKKNYLSNIYHNFLFRKNISQKNIEKIIYDIFQQKNIENLNKENLPNIEIDDFGLYIKDDNTRKLINIDSPLFKIVSKTKNFDKIFTIQISQKSIDKYNFKNYYRQVFNNINHSNQNNLSIFYLLNSLEKINYLKEINIDFNRIKRITLKVEGDKPKNIYENNNIIQENNKIFFTSLFSFHNIFNNLIYLNIIYLNSYKINSDLFEKINNFKLFIFKFM